MLFFLNIIQFSGVAPYNVLQSKQHYFVKVISLYSGAKKYLVSHQLCKFSHLKRWERPVIFIIGIPQLWETKWEKKSRKSHSRIFKEFICKLWWKISIWSPTNKQDCWLSQTCNFFFKRLICPPLVTCINGKINHNNVQNDHKNCEQKSQNHMGGPSEWPAESWDQSNKGYHQ